jgi:acetyltransferase-like isoleucine patch superfamily enzyme
VGLGSRIWSPGGLTIGDDVWVGRYCGIQCDGSIGSGVLIADHVGLVGRGDHDWRTKGVPMSRAPWIGRPGFAGPGAGLRIEVGDDVWFGYAAVVLSGVVVGRGAVVAAGSVVNRDVDPYAIVAGVPAVKVGERFDAADAAEHEALLQAHRREQGRG